MFLALGTDQKALNHLRDPQAFNSYTYGRDNPYKYVDPDGEFFGLRVAVSVARAVVQAVVVRAVYVPQVTSYITTSPEYRAVKETGNNTAMRTAIYEKAEEVTNGNKSTALLTATAATFSGGANLNTIVAGDPADTVGYSERMQNLPTNISGSYLAPGVSDSEREIDKNQHFFASAALSYNLGSTPADLLGYAFERLESPLSPDRFDPADISANRAGQEFGQELRSQ